MRSFHVRSFVSRRRGTTGLVTGVVAAGLVLGGGVALAAIPSTTTGQITGCVNKTTAAVRIIDYQAGKRCTTKESTVGWSKGWRLRGNWGAAVAYAVGDVALQGGSAYLAKIASKNASPATNTAIWGLVVSRGAVGPAGATGPQGETGLGTPGADGAQGSQGPQGPQGLSGTQALVMNSGPGIAFVSDDDYQFVTTPVSVYVPTGAKVLVTATQALGAKTTSTTINMYPGYRLAGAPAGTEPFAVGNGMFFLTLQAGTRVPFTVSGVVTGLTTGVYEFGMVASAANAAAVNDMDLGYTTALVTK